MTTDIIEHHIHIEKLMKRNGELLMPVHRTKEQIGELLHNCYQIAWLATKMAVFCKTHKTKRSTR